MYTAQFGCLSWSDCETSLLYIAEKNKNTSDAHDGEISCGKVMHTHVSQNHMILCRINPQTKENRKSQELPLSKMIVFLVFLFLVCVVHQDRSVYCEDWGETLTHKSSPVICVVNLQNGVVSVLQGVPPDVSPGQVRGSSSPSDLGSDCVRGPMLNKNKLIVWCFSFQHCVCSLGTVGSWWSVCDLRWLVP